jgi:hypothetical protein
MRAVWIVLDLLLLAPGTAAVVPSSAAAEMHWRVHAFASGGYALDYGAEHDAIDGQAGGSWSWDMRALASGVDVDTEIAVFRMADQESSSIVLTDGSPACRPPDLGPIGPVRDARVGLYYDRGQRGFQVDHPFFDSLGGCHVGAHGMTLYDGASPVATRVPQGAFKPRRDRSFERIWTQQIALDRGHEPGAPHTFSAGGELTIRLKRISARAARALRLRLRSTPRTPRA